MRQIPTTEPRNGLVLAPTTNPIEGVERVFDRQAALREWNVLIVAYGYSHRDLRTAWHDRIDDAPAAFGTITVGNGGDGGGDVAPVSRAGRDVTTSIRARTDLAELGTTISLYLDDWTEGRTLVCFHTLEDLLDGVGTQTAFRFLHVLTRRLAKADAVGRFSLDPLAVDERTIRTLEPLFDVVYQEGEEPPSITPETAFDVLRAPRRRYVLHYLRENPGPTTVAALADWVARYEPDADDGRLETSMYHSHLPKLENAGLISLDGTRVSGRPTIESLAPYLELVSGHDLPG
ncbi:hypothetical protein [Halalkalicoccus sp. NIPERK01]|uniref:DUF7504 family protein n=1 Tax=Halalkalicoccus sp. NIPERK01 TaxID=3053469 RepID=UPI00256EB75A|nr:hypothetical protein [Halalkalicoccus sp. NIPERK01]MDL5360893.1 hypothetical protein [Halalkalicoccus sp. NIPERK01]